MQNLPVGAIAALDVPGGAALRPGAGGAAHGGALQASFLLRYATRADFTSLATGQFSASAFWTVVAISAAAHPEWLAAAIASALFTWLLRHTRNLCTVIVAHAAANAAFWCYILGGGQWQFW